MAESWHLERDDKSVDSEGECEPAQHESAHMLRHQSRRMIGQRTTELMVAMLHRP
jgi:hypothetical protein